MANWLVPFEQLSTDQKRVISATPFEQNIFVEGPPGTGKTLVALHRARVLAESSGLKPMIVIYNHSLYGFLKKSIDELGMSQNIRVETKDSLIWNLAKYQGVDPECSMNYEEKYHSLMERIQLSRLPRLYDVIILDEIQDFYQKEWEILSRCGRYFIVLGDFAQRIYNADISRDTFMVGGNHVFQHFRLNTIYRFGKSVARVARGFGNTQLEHLVDRRADQRPLAIDVYNQNELIEKIREIVNVNQNGRKRIAIAAPEKYTLDLLKQYLSDDLVFYAPDNKRLRDFNFSGDRRALLITTYSLKGLEFDTVVVCGYSENSSAVYQMRKENRLIPNIFVALTRSNENLYIIRDSTTISELRNLDVDVLGSGTASYSNDDYFNF